MNLNGIKAIGGFFRYGFTLTVISKSQLTDQFEGMQYDQIMAIGEAVLKKAEELNGGFKMKLEEIIVQDGLMVFTDINRSWQVAFATDFERYMKWLRYDGALTADQYEKELKREPYAPREQDEN